MMPRPGRRSKSGTALLLFVALGVAAAPPARATVDSPVRSGDAVVAEPVEQTKDLTHGGSATEFSLRLPQGASCPGDSMHDQWRVQSFMVPEGDDPVSLKYGVMGPEGPGQFPLFDTATRPLTDSLTLANSDSGQPALIPAVPALSLVAFPPGVLAAGTYRVGIACTLDRKTAKYWDTLLVISDKPDDQPAQLAWRTPDTPESVLQSSDDQGTPWVPLALGTAVAIGIGWLLLCRRARTSPLTKESR